MQTSLLKETVDLVINSRYPDMDSHTREAIEKLLVPIKVPKGEIFVKEGELCKYLYFVGKGMLRQYYYKDAKDITEHFSYEGCIIMSIKSMLWAEPNNILAEALEDSILYRISYKELMQATKAHWGINLFYRKVLEYSLVVSQLKAYEWRFNTAQEKYELLMQRHPEVIKRAPLIHIASFLNITPETLSRVRAAII